MNILVCTSLTDPLFDRIVEALPNLRVIDGASLLIKELPDALRPGQQIPPARNSAETLDSLLDKTHILLSARRVPENLVNRAPELQWVQLPMAGVEWLMGSDLWKSSKIRLSTSAGITAGPVAEWTLMSMMALAKNLRRMLGSQGSRKWDRYDLGQLKGKTLGILGYGSIGKEVANLGLAFGMNVLATKREVHKDSNIPEWVFPAERMLDVMCQSDFLVIAVPITGETRQMIGREEIAHMKAGAYLLNVARGEVVDEEALMEALEDGSIAGAALDVFVNEPLGPDSRLWDAPNLIVSAHSGGLFADYDEAVVDLFIANVNSFTNGGNLSNEVNRSVGY